LYALSFVLWFVLSSMIGPVTVAVAAPAPQAPPQPVVLSSSHAQMLSLVLLFTPTANQWFRSANDE
jgi:hypothetical protein